MLKILNFLLCVSIVMALASCDDQPELKIAGDDESQLITSNPIIDAAQKAYESCFGVSSRSNATFYKYDIVPVATLRSRATSADTVLYFVNEANGNGFVALTGGKHPEILAVSDNGSIESVDSIDNPGLKMFVEAAIGYAFRQNSSQIGSGAIVDPIPLFKEEIELVHNDFCAPRCDTQWGQEYPEGLYCPNKLSGCMATAAAQILCYFNEPLTVKLTYPDADITTLNIDWNELKTYASSMTWAKWNSSLIKKKPIELKNETNLGRLCRELGYKSNALYESNMTTCSLEDMFSAMCSMNGTLVCEVVTGKPVARNSLGSGLIFMKGTGMNISQSGNGEYNYESHAWIIDGYKYLVENHYVYVYDETTGKYVYSEENSYVYECDLQHINWGWNGRCNGFYNLGVFNTTEVANRDDSNIADLNDPEYNYFLSFKYLRIFKLPSFQE